MFKVHYTMTRCRSKHQPYPIYTTVLCGQNIPSNMGYRPKISDDVLNLMACYPKPQTPPNTMKQKIIQTMFRESEAQTDPYVVDVPRGVDKGLEILTLGWLSWSNGLPAGMTEIQIIERARQRRAWEAALPLPLDETSKEIRRMIIEAIEINEWRFREDTIAAVNSLRADLAKKMLKEKALKNRLKYEKRLNKYIEIKKEEKFRKIQKLRISFNRQIRKLIFTKEKVNKKYHRADIIKQFTDPTSELYAPQMRFGEDPRHWHEKITSSIGFWRGFKKLEIMHHTISDVPRTLLPAFDYEQKSKPKKRVQDLCIRSTKWTETNLEVLYEELRNIRWKRFNSPRPCHLKKKVQTCENEAETPIVVGVSDEEEEMFQACLFLQKTIKGRAIQAVMFEGRVKCQELIEELKSTHALQSHVEEENGRVRKKIYELQRKAEIELLHQKKKKEILCNLAGKTTGDMLDFLSKELLRLQNERMTHALALLADQERHKREAAEAGRRQAEEQRRREHDEMYKQIIKMHQNTVHSFLNELFTNTKEWLGHRWAREYVTEMAKKIDQAAVATTMVSIFTRADDLLEEEIVADLIHNFALPEVQKRIVRQRLQDRQRNYLKICHDEVYSNIEKVVEGSRTRSGELIPLARPEKHRIPSQVRVKYRHLKRTHESSSSSVDSQNSKNSASSTLNEQFFSNLDSKINSQVSTDKEMWSTGFSRQDVILRND